MQAQKTGLLDLTCKDKFLIQNTIVPAGTVDEDVTSEMVASSICSKSFHVCHVMLSHLGAAFTVLERWWKIR